MVEKLKIGDRKTYRILYSDGTEENGEKVIVGIIQKPRDPKQNISFIRSVVDGMSDNQGFLDGDNLRDDPEFESRSDPNVIYILE